MINLIFANILNLFGIGGLVVALFLFFFTDPFESPKLILYIFYLALFVAIFGMYSLFEFNIRRKIQKLQSEATMLKNSMFDAMLVASVISLLLFLQMLRVLSLWDALLLIICVFLLKLYISAKQPKY